MSKYDALNGYKGAKPEERLATLAIEMLHPITIIRGFSLIIKGKIEAERPYHLKN